MLDHPPPEAWYYISLVFLLFCSMFFSSGETAFISCNLLRIKYLSKKSIKAKRVLKIISEKHKFLITSLIGNSIVNILVGVVLTSLTLHFSSKNAVTIATLIATTLVLIFGEIVPKSIALVFPEAIAIHYSKLTHLIIKIFLPISSIFIYLTSFIVQIFKIKVGMKGSLISEDDLKTFFEHSAGEGRLSKDEKEIMDKILKYDDLVVKNIMVPRPQIIALNINASIEEALKVSKSSSLSRFPIYEHDIDDIKGVLYIKDFLFSKEYIKTLDDYNNKKEIKLKDFLREPCFIFSNTQLTNARNIMEEKEQNIAIVIDEYGGTQGLITIEDLNEEIFGEIVDEYDRPLMSTPLFYKKCKEGFIIEGSVPLSLLNEQFNFNLSSNFNMSLAGFIMEVCGKVPEVGFSIDLEGFTFVVKKLNGNRIEKVLMKER